MVQYALSGELFTYAHISHSSNRVSARSKNNLYKTKVMSYRYLQPPVGERQPHSVRRACHAGSPTVSCGSGWTGRRAKPLAIALFPSKVQVGKRGSLVTIYRHQLELYSSIVERDVHLPSPNHHLISSKRNYSSNVYSF